MSLQFESIDVEDFAVFGIYQKTEEMVSFTRCADAVVNNFGFNSLSRFLKMHRCSFLQKISL